MKRVKIEAPKNNAKISDYFKKITTKEPQTSKECDNKRKLCDLTVSPEKNVLNSVTNLPQIYAQNKVSPCSKKTKQFENGVSVVECEQAYFLQDLKCEQIVQDCGHNSSTFSNVDTNTAHCDPSSESNNFKVVTPEKIMKPSTNMKTPTPKKNSESRSSAKKNSTPQSSRKGTPRKLFEKSPRNLNEFNVQVLEDFVQISPSKSNKIITVVETPSKAHLRNNSSFCKSLYNESPKSESNLLDTHIKSEIISIEDTKLIDVDQMKKEMANELDEHHADELDMALNDMLNQEFDDLLEKLNKLTFDEPQYCKILEVEKNNSRVILKLMAQKNKNIGVCYVEEFWSYLNFKVGDTVCVSAVKSASDTWIINNDAGWLVYEPNLLISCTSVVGSLFCKRRGILSERFRGFEADNRVMIIGVLIHHLLQNVLKNKLKTAIEMEALLKNMLKSHSTVKRLYDNNLTLEDIESELLAFIPKMVEFVQQYVNDSPTYKPDPSNWTGKITKICDIEENIWCPQLGVKGKIDVTVQTLFNIMPLEMKTGRASISLEHRGQVMLYIMMMNKFGYKVSSGLLLYLREGVLKEIKATEHEKRDLMILRNELAYFLTRKTTKVENGSKSILKPPELPEPINHRACAKCPYNAICASYLKSDNYDLSNNSTLLQVQNHMSTYLSEAHLNYFLHWSSMLSLGDEGVGFKNLQEIYTVDPEKREEQGKCIINLKVVAVEAECNSLHKHVLEKNKSDGVNLLTFGISENSYVIVSTDTRPAVASGFVTDITSRAISVALDRNLQMKYPDKLFHLDTYDSSIAQSFNLTSLALLLEDTPRAAQLRNIIIDKTPPTFVNKLPAVVAKRGAPILRRLNHVQQKAVLKALCAKEYLLIKGMPGTGKTATIVALIQLLVELDKSVLVTSHTHSAIDNICTRLLKFGVDFIRLGSESRIHSNLKSKSEATLTRGCKTPEDFERVYNSFKVIVVTCLGSAHPLLSKRTVDVCIVDESTQAIQTSVIRPLYAAKTFVLIGDPEQLAPVVRNRDALNAGMSESLFERLINDDSENIVTLNINYRMNSTITELVNALTYKGELKTANDLVANNSLYLPNKDIVKSLYNNHGWLLKALDTSLEAAVQFIDTGPVWQLAQNIESIIKNCELNDNSDVQNCLNIYEAAIVAVLVKALMKGGVSNVDIGVIATYRAQVAQISTLLSSLNVDISTVDQFQGRDKNVIIYSCAKSKDMTKTMSDLQKFELLEDKKRLTVAISRAKQKLLMIGDSTTLRNYSTLATILQSLKTDNIIQFDSDWKTVLDLSNFD